MKRFAPLTWADVSRHRAVLYGFAALWIAFLHMEYTVPSSGPLVPLRSFQSMGACGVEIFVLLTGAGLYLSMERDPSALRFYQKRLERVFVPAVIVGAINFGLRNDGVLSWLLRLSYLSYWLGIETFWYVAFILTMYLIYPALYRLQKRCPGALWGLFALTVLGAFFASCVRCDWTLLCIRGVARIPVFILSCILAPRLVRGMKLPLWLIPLCFAMSYGFYLLAQVDGVPLYFMRTVSYVCLAVVLILLITWLCERFCRGSAGRGAYRFFAFCGGCSLEIYLLFERVCRWMKQLPRYVSGELGLLKLELLCLFITILLSWLLTRLCHSLIQAFKQIQVPDGRNAG